MRRCEDLFRGDNEEAVVHRRRRPHKMAIMTLPKSIGHGDPGCSQYVEVRLPDLLPPPPPEPAPCVAPAKQLACRLLHPAGCAFAGCRSGLRLQVLQPPPLFVRQQAAPQTARNPRSRRRAHPRAPPTACSRRHAGRPERCAARGAGAGTASGLSGVAPTAGRPEAAGGAPGVQQVLEPRADVLQGWSLLRVQRQHLQHLCRLRRAAAASVAVAAARAHAAAGPCSGRGTGAPLAAAPRG